ncbi:unnamed protein product [Commensalibacter communis]|nr:unnamed protein product [Commensalibacter communis]CAI3945146.1 unnamed protein product [Commensalibacter communis]
MSVIDTAISKLDTAIPAKVIAVNIKDKTVNLQSMIDKKTLDGTKVSMGPMHNVPYLRLQGGVGGIICDPQVGDEGFVVFASRDISNVKNSSIPASDRVCSRSDGVYIGALYNQSPTTYIKITNGVVEIEAPQVRINGDLMVTGDVVASGVSLKEHIHGNGDNGADTTPPKGA